MSVRKENYIDYYICDAEADKTGNEAAWGNGAIVWVLATNAYYQVIAGAFVAVTTVQAITSGTLAQFAATTSAQLFGIISDETGGSGVLVGSASPTFTGTPILATPTATSGGITGTGGNGFWNFPAQSSDASAPGAIGFRLFANSTGSMAWAKKSGADTFVRNFASTNTADKTYTWPDASGTVVLSGTTAGGDLTGTYVNPTIGTNKVTLAKMVQASAHTFWANNTASTANVAENTYNDQPLQTYAGTITWNGTTPTSLTSQQYAWAQIGGWVTLRILVVYSGAGVTNTNVSFTLPTDCPTPSNFAGLGANASEVISVGFGRIEPTITSAPGNARAWLAKNAANNGYTITAAAASSSAKVGEVFIVYRTS